METDLTLRKYRLRMATDRALRKYWLCMAMGTAQRKYRLRILIGTALRKYLLRILMDTALRKYLLRILMDPGKTELALRGRQKRAPIWSKAWDIVRPLCTLDWSFSGQLVIPTTGEQPSSQTYHNHLLLLLLRGHMDHTLYPPFSMIC